MGVSEDELRVPCGNTEILEKGRGGVAEVVVPDATEAVLLAEGVEGSDEVLRLLGTTGGAGEDEV